MVRYGVMGRKGYMGCGEGVGMRDDASGTCGEKGWRVREFR